MKMPQNKLLDSILLATIFGLLSATTAWPQASSIVNTTHNLSVSGPGTIKSETETEICRFCHIPHNAEIPVPLWGHRMSRAQYAVPTLRSGSGTIVPAPQPDGASRLCLSCHDGTVALGEVTDREQQIPVSGSGRLTPIHSGFIGTDLSGSHPISFVYPEQVSNHSSVGHDMGTRSRSEIENDPAVKLDAQGKMQCTTCHNPHNDQYYRPGIVPHFWVKPTVDGVCLTCHDLF